MPDFDPEKRAALVEKMRAQGLPTVVPLEDFFDGNDDYGSIGCNLFDAETIAAMQAQGLPTAGLHPHPGPQGFFVALVSVRGRPDVQDVLVYIEMDEDDPTMWPFSDTVLILTSAARKEVLAWVRPLSPDSVDPETWGHLPEPSAMPVLEEGMRVQVVWWD